MKISNYIYPGAVKSYNRNNVKQKSDITSGFSQALDTVEISSDGINRLEDKDVRMDKVISIKKQIDAGKYEINIAAAARNILYGSSLY